MTAKLLKNSNICKFFRYIFDYIKIFSYLCTRKMQIGTTKNEVNRALVAKNMCSHLQRKLFDAEGVYRAIREEIERDEEITTVVRSRQLHIYRNGKKILVLAGKSAPKIIREDKLNTLL